MANKIIAKVESLSIYDIDGLTPKGAVDFFSDLTERYEGKQATLVVDAYDGEVEFYVAVHRDETPAEIAKREAMEWQRDQFERKRYEALKKKYEPEESQ